MTRLGSCGRHSDGTDCEPLYTAVYECGHVVDDVCAVCKVEVEQEECNACYHAS